MKIKHNKKRNTAFIYEALIRELTVATMRGDTNTKNNVVRILKKHFSSNSLLKKELDCYRALSANQGISVKTSEKLVKEAKRVYGVLDPNGIFKNQTELINDINKEIGQSVFGNFVPNYKTLATISQIFSGGHSPKKTVMLENQIINDMTLPSKHNQKTNGDSLDIKSDVFKTFTNKFNDKYGTALTKEQRELLNRYIMSFADNSLELKMFLNEEISVLKERLSSVKNVQEFGDDKDMLAKAAVVVKKLEGFASEGINEDTLLTVMKTQELVKEIYNNVDSD